MRKLINFALLKWLSLAISGILMSSFVLAGENQWTSIGLEGAEVTALAIDPFTPVTIYAGTQGLGIFKSIDGGESWTDINNGLPYAYSSNILLIDPVTPTTIYSGGYMSTDGGESWTAIEYPVIAIDPVTPTILYSGSWDPWDTFSGYKSTDDGENWTFFVNDFEYRNLVALAIDPVDTNTLYAADRSKGPGIWDLFAGNVYKSTDGGDSWLTINNGLTGNYAHILVIDPLAATTLYASLLGYGVYGLYKTTDGGENWFDIIEDLTWLNDNGEIRNCFVVDLVINPTTPDTLYAGTDGQGVYKSTDGGESWTAINSDLANLSIHALAIDPINPTTIYAGIDGVYSFEDLGSDSADSADVLDSSDSSDSSDFF